MVAAAWAAVAAAATNATSAASSRIVSAVPPTQKKKKKRGALDGERVKARKVERPRHERRGRNEDADADEDAHEDKERRTVSLREDAEERKKDARCRDGCITWGVADTGPGRVAFSRWPRFHCWLHCWLPDVPVQSC